MVAMTIRVALSWALVMVIAGCGGAGTPEAKEGDKVSAMDALGMSGPEVPWEEMDEADREFYMVGKVNPIMQQLFGRHDAEEYGEFSCEQCHGEEMRELKFKMPAPSMYRVAKPGTPAHKGMLLTFPETVKFMQEVVTPSMGTLLGKPDFTCSGCHPS